MATSVWGFLHNPFLTRGGRNYKVAYELAKFTDAALFARIGDPYFNGLYIIFHPLFQSLEAEYNDWESQRGIQKGSTASLDNLLEQLSTNDEANEILSKINEWQVAVQAVFPKITPTYIAIFPLGSAPFMNGEKDARIAAVAALSVTLGGYPALAAVKANVDAFLALLNAARLTQQGKISDTATDSDEVSVAVETAMVGMFAVYGSLINHFAATPESAGALFDLELLRNLPQTRFIGSVAALQTKFIVKRTLDNQRKVKLTNSSSHELTFSVTSEKNDPVEGGFVLAGNEDVTLNWGQLKQHEDSTYLKVYNPSPDAVGHYRVDILPEGDE